MTTEYDNLRKSTAYAEEAFVVEVQSLLQTIMNERQFTRSELAAALGVSKARISQIFSDECKNLTIRLLARAASVMGERVEVTSECHKRISRDRELENIRRVVGQSHNVIPTWHYAPVPSGQCANDLDVTNDSLVTKAQIVKALRKRDESEKQVAA